MNKIQKDIYSITEHAYEFFSVIWKSLMFVLMMYAMGELLQTKLTPFYIWALTIMGLTWVLGGYTLWILRLMWKQQD